MPAKGLHALARFSVIVRLHRDWNSNHIQPTETLLVCVTWIKPQSPGRLARLSARFAFCCVEDFSLSKNQEFRNPSSITNHYVRHILLPHMQSSSHIYQGILLWSPYSRAVQRMQAKRHEKSSWWDKGARFHTLQGLRICHQTSWFQREPTWRSPNLLNKWKAYSIHSAGDASWACLY